MNTLTFPSFRVIGPSFTHPKLPDGIVKNEPMLFAADLGHAWIHGGPITRDFIEAFAKRHPNVDLQRCVIDTRVHMLMEGFWPCIPGWHHDDVPRGENGQPNYANPAYKANHCIGLVNGHLAPTEFAQGYAKVSDPTNHARVYGKWTHEVDAQVEAGKLLVDEAPSGVLIDFTCDTFHRGTRAVESGWRWFGRITWDTDREVLNETRNQVQVYMDDPEGGW